jgi:hypothetical protein
MQAEAGTHEKIELLFQAVAAIPMACVCIAASCRWYEGGSFIFCVVS